MDCSPPGSSVLHYLLEFVCSTFPSSRWCHPTISSSSAPFSFCPQSFPASGSFPVSQLITLGGQSIGASASVLPMNIQDWFPLGSTGLILLMIHPLLWLHYYESYWESLPCKDQNCVFRLYVIWFISSYVKHPQTKSHYFPFVIFTFSLYCTPKVKGKEGSNEDRKNSSIQCLPISYYALCSRDAGLNMSSWNPQADGEERVEMLNRHMELVMRP